MKDTNLSLDDVFGALAHQHRRYVLSVLADHDTSLTLLDIANEIAARECDMPVDDLSEETVETVHLSLYHCHVPKLAAVGLVAYDRETDFVDLADSTKPLLATLQEGTIESEIRQC